MGAGPHEQAEPAPVLQQASVTQRLQRAVHRQRIEQVAAGQRTHRGHGVAFRDLAVQQPGGQLVGQLLVDR
jgi:hypothetical protein